jgi:hypothetical protein
VCLFVASVHRLLVVVGLALAAAGILDGLGLGPNSKAIIMRQVRYVCLALVAYNVHCVLADICTIFDARQQAFVDNCRA